MRDFKEEDFGPSEDQPKEIKIGGEVVHYYEADSSGKSELFRQKVLFCQKKALVLGGTLFPDGRVVFMIDPPVNHDKLREKLGIKEDDCVDFVYYPEETTPETNGLLAVYGYRRDNRCGTVDLNNFLARSFPPELGKTRLCATCLRVKLEGSWPEKVFEGPLSDWRT